MQHSLQVQEVRRLLDLMARGTTQYAPDVWHESADVYSSPERLAAERERLFRGQPMAVALSADMPNPGDWLTEDLGPQPLLLTRTPEGEVKAFLNVCRHRGARVASGSGTKAKRFTCPYHAWTYDTSGNLVAIPEKEAFEGMDCDTRGLIGLPVIERHGVIFVRFDQTASLKPEETFGPLDEQFESFGFGGYHLYERRTITVPINWKLVIDGFLEAYHLRSLHKKTVDPVFLSRHCTGDTFGKHVRMIIPRKSFPQMKEQPEKDWDLIRHTAMIYVLFPSTIFVVQGDHLETWNCYPSGDKTDECTFHLGFYIPEPATTDSARRHWDKNMDLVVNTVLKEDIPTSRGIQVSSDVGAQKDMVFGRNEPALIAYHRALRDALAA